MGHLLLAMIVLIVFGQTLTFDYVGFDDVDYVRDRDRIHDGLTLKNIGWSFTTLTKANYHPLTWLSYMADVTFLGLGAGEFHFTNTLLHLINTLLLFELLSRMTGDRWRSFLVGRTVRDSPAACRIGGLDLRTQRHAQYAVRPGGHLGLCELGPV